MKRISLLFIVLLLTTHSCLSQNTIKETTVNLNFRSEPHLQSYVIEVIPQGTSVRLLENCDCEWITILYNGNIGYINTKYLKNPTRKSEVYTKSYTTKKTGSRYYINSQGFRVQSPTYYNSPPVGATALCRDGTYSFSRSRRGTCSHHGGVAKWL